MISYEDALALRKPDKGKRCPQDEIDKKQIVVLKIFIFKKKLRRAYAKMQLLRANT